MAYMRQVGLGEYEKTGDWSWEFYPPPYNFLAPRDSASMPAPVLYTPLASGPGLGCACGGSCGHCSSASGGGLGLFDAGFDVSQWGTGEWVAAGAIGYLALKIVGDVMRTGQKVRRAVRKRSYKKSRKAELKKELATL